MRRLSMILLAMLAWIATTPGLFAATDQQVARIGTMTIRTDAARWRVTSVSSDELLLVPTGSLAGKHDAIRILRRTGASIDACAGSARRRWPASLYNEPRLSIVAAAGRDWRRIDTHTRCRNATPTGVMLCTVYDGNLYTLALLNRVSTCRNVDGVLFPQSELLDELLAGLSFTH